MQFLLEHDSFALTGINLFIQNLRSFEEGLLLVRLVFVCNPVAFMLLHDALRADVYLVVLAEVFCFLLRVAETVLVGQVLLVRGSDVHVLSVLVEVVCKVDMILTDDSEVLDQLLHIWRKVLSACGTGEDVGSAQIHQARLAEGVAALQNSRHFLLVIKSIKADRASDVHFEFF